MFTESGFNLLLAFLVLGSRLFFRVLDQVIYRIVQNEDEHRRPILIYGAGNNGRVAAEEVQRDPSRRYKVIGFIDDNPELIYRRIWGFKVLGGRSVITELLKRHGVDHLLISTPKIDPNLLAEELLAQGVNQAKAGQQADP